MYQRVSETVDMSTIAERTHAMPVVVFANQTLDRGYHFNPRTMSDEDKDFVFRSVYPVGLEAFSQNASEGMENDIADHIFNTDNLLVIRSDGTIKFGSMEIGVPRPIAFCVWQTYDLPIGRALYISGVCVNPSWQGRGIGRAMQQYAYAYESLDGKRVDYAFMSTQNAVEKLSFDRAFMVKSFPKHNVADVHQHGQMFAHVRGLTNYDHKDMRLKRHYGGSSLYGVLPKCENGAYEALFERLDRSVGDAYLCVTPKL